MNLRHKHKAFKKLQAMMLGEESGFGQITPREGKAAVEFFVWHLRQVSKTAKAAQLASFNAPVGGDNDT